MRALLRSEIHHLGYPRSFVIYDEADRLALVRECYRELASTSGRSTPAAAIARISRAKNQLPGPEAVEEPARGTARGGGGARSTRGTRPGSGRWARVDFDDLLGLTVSSSRGTPRC